MTREPWLDPALRLLLRYRLAAAARSALRSLARPSGVAFAVVVVALGGFFVWLAVAAPTLPGATPVTPGGVRAGGTTYFALLWTMTLVLRGGGDVLGFVPAETDQIFAAPLRPAHVLRYKLALLVFALVSLSTAAAVVLLPFSGRFDVAWVAVLLASLLIQLTPMAATLAFRVRPRVRWAVAAVLAVLLAVGVWRLRSAGEATPDAIIERLGALYEHPAVAVLVFPFTCLPRALLATSWVEAAPWLAVLAALDLALATAIVRLGETSWFDLAHEGSEQVAERFGRLRGGSLFAVGRVRAVRVPRLPFLGGVGLVAQRQLAEMVRRPVGLLTLLALASGLPMLALVGFVLTADDPEARLAASRIAVGAQLPLLSIAHAIVPSVVRADFRGDVDRLDLLLGLPLPRWAIVLGQVLPAAVLLSALVVPFSAVAALLLDGWRQQLALAVVVIHPLAALWQLLVENVVFLWMPYRIEMGEAAIEASGRGMVAYLASQAVTWLGFAAIVGGAVGIVIGAGLAPWVAVGLVAGGLVAADGLALLVGDRVLRRFDPTVSLR